MLFKHKERIYELAAALEISRSILDDSRNNTGWSKREPDNKIKQSHKQLEKLDIEFMNPKGQMKHRIQYNTIKS